MTFDSNRTKLIDNTSESNEVTHDAEAGFLNEPLPTSKLIEFINSIISVFFITPIVILFWSSTWDIFYDYLQFSFLINNIITFFACNFVLLNTYIWQYKLQAWHNKLHETSIEFSEIVNLDQSDRRCYYGKSFFLRTVYTYVLTLAYVLQWKTYWETYNYLTQDAYYGYFVLLSIITLLVYRIILKRSLVAFTKTVPFYLTKDEEFSAFFIQAKVIKLNDHTCIENFLNFVYFEFVEMLISVYAWKGLWDLIDIGLEIDLLERMDELNNYKIVSLIITGLAGYLIYFFLVFIQNFRINKIIKEIIQIFAYLSVVMLWRTVWDGFDLFIPLSGNIRACILFSTHFLSMIILSLLKVGSTLYGPCGSESDSESTVEDDSNKKPIKMFEIRYFTQ